MLSSPSVMPVTGSLIGVDRLWSHDLIWATVGKCRIATGRCPGASVTPPVTSAVGEAGSLHRWRCPSRPRGRSVPRPARRSWSPTRHRSPYPDAGRWRADSRKVGRRHADRPGDDRGESFALLTGKAIAGRGDDRDVHRRELADQVGDLLAVSAVVGKPVLSVVSSVGKRHIHRGDIVLGCDW